MHLKTYTLIAILFLSSISLFSQSITGNGNWVTQKRSISSFSKLKVSGHFEVQITEALTNEISLQAEENLLPHIVSEIKKGTLILRPKRTKILKPSRGRAIQIKIPSEALQAIALAGSGKILGEHALNTNEIQIKQSGSGSINLKLECQFIESKQSGSGTIHLEGRTKKLIANNSGSGKLLLSALQSQEVKAHMAGSGKIKLNAVDNLEAIVNGSGLIYYKTTPNLKISSQIDGSGAIKEF